MTRKNSYALPLMSTVKDSIRRGFPSLGSRGSAGEFEGAELDAIVRAQHYLGRQALLECLEIFRTVIVQVARDFRIQLDDQRIVRRF